MTVKEMIKELSKLPEDSLIVGVWWEEADVRSLNDNLTDEQVADVINKLEHQFDASIGIDWDIVELRIEEVLA